MHSNLPFLQPKIFSFRHNDFLYEVVAAHEYYSDGIGIDLSGNFLLTVLTPNGTIQTTIDARGDEYMDDHHQVLGLEICKMILKQIDH